MQWSLFTAGGYDVTDLEHQNNNIQIRDACFFSFFSSFFARRVKKNLIWTLRNRGASAFSVHEAEGNESASVQLHVLLIFFDALGKMISLFSL